MIPSRRAVRFAVSPTLVIGRHAPLLYTGCLAPNGPPHRPETESTSSRLALSPPTTGKSSCTRHFALPLGPVLWTRSMIMRHSSNTVGGLSSPSTLQAGTSFILELQKKWIRGRGQTHGQPKKDCPLAPGGLTLGQSGAMRRPSR